jgi:hypothetical protein
VGGRGSTFFMALELPSPGSMLWPTATGDFVSVPMASFVIAGGTQTCPLPGNDLLDFIGRASEGRAPEKLLGLGFDRNDEIITFRHDTAEHALRAMNSRVVLLAA